MFRPVALSPPCEISFYGRGNTRLAPPQPRRTFRGFNPRLIFLLYCFHRFLIIFHHETMGKQSRFTRQNGYDVLCTISSALHRSSTLEVDLRRTQKNFAVLASHLHEARFVKGILEDALFSLLPPVPNPPTPPLPPRLDAVMDPPATQENPDPTVPTSSIDPLPHRDSPVEPLPGSNGQQTPTLFLVQEQSCIQSNRL